MIVFFCECENQNGKVAVAIGFAVLALISVLNTFVKKDNK